jgi:hypothetical protein
MKCEDVSKGGNDDEFQMTFNYVLVDGAPNTDRVLGSASVFIGFADDAETIKGKIIDDVLNQQSANFPSLGRGDFIFPDLSRE